jgi:hypothetical protein
MRLGERHPLVEGVGDRAQGLERHGGGLLGALQEPLRIRDRQAPDPGGLLGPVDQGQPIATPQVGQGDAGPRHGLGAGQKLAVEPGAAFADQRQSHVGKRRQVTAGTDRAALGNVGREALVEHSQQGVERLRLDTGHPAGKYVGAHHHHGARGLAVHRCADTRSVAA